MATEVIEGNEVILNSVPYPLVGQLQRALTSLFPEKMVTGDYSVVSDVNKSSWVIADQRGGILIEEMDERKHANRCYWSTCNLGFKGHIILPHLATAVTTGDVDNVPSIVNSDMELETGWDYSDAAVTRDDTQKHGDTYSLKIAGTNKSTGQYITGWTPGVQYTLPCWAFSNSHGSTNTRIGIYDGVDTTYSTAVASTNSWEQLSVQKTLSISATCMRLVLDHTGASSSWFDDAGDITMDDSAGAATYGTLAAYANFNSNLYITLGKCLAILNSAADEFLTMWQFGATITDLVPFGSTALLVFLGDATNYEYIETDFSVSGATATDVADATYGLEWDSKAFKSDSAGQLAYTATPNAASPTWTNNGALPIADNELQSLTTYYNIDGDDVIYAGTKVGLFIHDYANAKWLQTELKTPNHANSGKGLAVWRDGLFVTAGLDILKYVPDVPAQIISMGLDRDDGLPVEQAGEITKLIPGYNEFYALVDANEVSGTGYSTVMAWDDRGWQCKWADSTADQAFRGGIVSSVVAYNLWFTLGTTTYKIPLHRNLRNPLKISTDTHATGSMHITPWFDADWQVGNKLALKLEVDTGGDVSADEIITIKYRTDHSNTDRDTFGSVVKTITSSGLNTYTFGSSVGTAFKAIQFRFDLARKAADTDETPDILYAVLYYKKVLPKKWGWRFRVDCSHPYHGRSAHQLLDALVTAAELGTLVTFVYDTTTKYVEIRSVTAVQDTGRVRKGMYDVFCTEL